VPTYKRRGKERLGGKGWRRGGMGKGGRVGERRKEGRGEGEYASLALGGMDAPDHSIFSKLAKNIAPMS